MMPEANIQNFGLVRGFQMRQNTLPVISRLELIGIQPRGLRCKRPHDLPVQSAGAVAVKIPKCRVLRVFFSELKLWPEFRPEWWGSA